MHYSNQREYKDIDIQDKATCSSRYAYVEGLQVPCIHIALLPGLTGIWDLIIDTYYCDSRIKPPIDEETEVNTDAKPGEGTKDLEIHKKKGCFCQGPDNSGRPVAEKSSLEYQNQLISTRIG